MPCNDHLRSFYIVSINVKILLLVLKLVQNIQVMLEINIPTVSWFQGKSKTWKKRVFYIFFKWNCYYFYKSAFSTQFSIGYIILMAIFFFFFFLFQFITFYVESDYSSLVISRPELSSMVATTHIWLWSIWNEASLD